MGHGPYFLCSSSWAAVFWLSRSTWFRISSSSWGVRGASELSCCCLRCRCCQTLTLGGGGSKMKHPSNYNQIHSFILQHQIPQPMTFGIKYHDLPLTFGGGSLVTLSSFSNHFWGTSSILSSFHFCFLLQIKQIDLLLFIWNNFLINIFLQKYWIWLYHFG